MRIFKNFLHRNKVQTVYCIGWVSGIIYQAGPTAVASGKALGASIMTFL